MVESEMGAVAWGQWPSPRFPSLLIEPDVRIYRIRLSDWLHPRPTAGQVGAGVLGTALILAPLRGVEWVVYAKEPFAGPQPVLRYLSRYTHRVAILAIALALSPLATRSRARRHCSS